MLLFRGLMITDRYLLYHTGLQQVNSRESKEKQ